MTQDYEFMRKKPAQRRALATIDTILDATAQLLDEADYDSLSTNHVAERAGYSIGTLYNYFPDKASLVHALVSREIKRAGLSAPDVIAAHRNDGIEGVIRALIRFSRAPFQGRPNIRRHIAEIVLREPRLLAEQDALIDRITDLLLDALGTARDTTPERRFLLLRSMIFPMRYAAMRAPHLLESDDLEDELVTHALALLRQMGPASGAIPAGVIVDSLPAADGR